MSFEVPDFTRSQQRTEDVNILGIDNVSTSANANLSLNDTLSNNPDSQQKKKIRTTKITFETFKSKRGLPALFKQLSSFKFQRKNTKSNSSKLGKNQFASTHHLNNLSRILEIYQAWGHSLNPQMKFESLIQTLNSSLSDVSSKNYLQSIILNEKQRRRDKIEQKRQQQSINPNSDDNIETEEIPIEILNESEHIQDWQQDDELWPEMFGGQSTEQAQPLLSQRVHFEIPESQQQELSEPHNNSGSKNDEFSDDELFDASQVRQMVSFSTMLDTSSQIPLTSAASVNNTYESQSSNINEDANNTTGGFDDFLSDDDADDNIRASTQNNLEDTFQSRFQMQADVRTQAEVEVESSSKTSKKVVPQISDSDDESDQNDDLNFL